MAPMATTKFLVSSQPRKDRASERNVRWVCKTYLKLRENVRNWTRRSESGDWQSPQTRRGFKGHKRPRYARNLSSKTTPSAVGLIVTKEAAKNLEISRNSLWNKIAQRPGGMVINLDFMGHTLTGLLSKIEVQFDILAMFQRHRVKIEEPSWNTNLTWNGCPKLWSQKEDFSQEIV